MRRRPGGRYEFAMRNGKGGDCAIMPGRRTVDQRQAHPLKVLHVAGRDRHPVDRRNGRDVAVIARNRFANCATHPAQRAERIGCARIERQDAPAEIAAEHQVRLRVQPTNDRLDWRHAHKGRQEVRAEDHSALRKGIAREAVALHFRSDRSSHRGHECE